MATAQSNNELSISWAHPIGTRDGTLTTDAKMVNCFAEKEEGESSAVVKRPGTEYWDTAVTGTAQGFFKYHGIVYYIVNDNAYVLQNPGSPTGIAIPVANAGQFFTSIDSLNSTGNTLVQNQAGELFVFDGSTFTKVTDSNYAGNVPQFGIAYLDGVYYAMTAAGNVIGSAINDPTTWPALDFVGADPEFGQGVTVSRHLNYILAFYFMGLQVYWDANAAPNGSGIALNPVLSASFRTGAFNAACVSEINDVTYFLANTPLYGRSVQMLNGLTLQKISDQYVERILNNPNLNFTSLHIWSFGIQLSGHSFYVLNLSSINVTLVYDITTGLWNTWSSVIDGVEQYFVGRGYTSAEGANADFGDFIQDVSTGKPMLMSPTLYTDATGNINMTCVTPNYDWGTLNWKRFAVMQQIADTQTAGTTVNVSYSDDDYQTFSTPRQIDMSTVRKQMRNCGSSRRRAWMLQFTGNTPMRLNDMRVLTAGLPR